MGRRALLVMVLAVTMASTADARWELDDHLDHIVQSVNFRVSHFLEGGTYGWVTATNRGTDPMTVVVFRTTDGGENWERIDTPVTGESYEIDFVDANNGWLSADGGHAPFRTRDGGRTWTAESCVGGWADNELVDLQMLSTTEGYGCGQTADDAAFFSYDGTTWRPLPVGAPSRIRLNFMDAKDPTHMWAVGTGRFDARGFARIGSTEFVTLDLPIFPCPWSLHFYDNSNGWIGAGATIVHTTDGGLTWEEQEIGTMHAVRAIGFTSPTVGRACTNFGELLTTSNGGDRWNVNRITPGSLSDLDYWPGAWQITGVQGWFSWQDTERTQPRLAETADLPRPPRNTQKPRWVRMESFEDARGSAHPTGACFLGDDHIWIAAREGGNPVIFLSEDAGATWERVPIGHSSPQIHDIQFVDENNGWISLTFDPCILRTTDGGRHWMPVKLAGGWRTGDRVTDLEMLNAGTGYAILYRQGTPSRLIAWRGGAGSWAPRDMGIPDAITELFFRDDSHAWFVKNLSAGWRSVEGGSVAPMSMGAGGAVECSFSRDGQRGWLGGQRIIRTTNGGATWQDQGVALILGGAMVKDIFFRDNDNGCTVSNSRDILITSNGGVKWSQAVPSEGRGTLFDALNTVAWFNDAWTVVGTNGILREASRDTTMTAAHGSIAERLRATPAAPALDWVGEARWIGRGHGLPDPHVGQLDTLRVVYSDRNGDEPRSVVCVITDPTGAVERRTIYPYTGSPTTGRIYERPYGWALHGMYHYRFEATDSTGRDAIGPPTEEQHVYVSDPGEPRY